MTTQNRIVNPAPPNLPLGTDQYERRYQDQFTNVLRLYFNQLRNALTELLGNTGGKYVDFPYGAFQDTAYTTLNGGINNSVTTITVVSTANFPTAGQIRIASEVITYTGITSTTFTGCTRGARGSANVAHSTGVAVTKIQSPVAKSNTYVITEEFTGMIFTRMRGRQMIFKISSNQINTVWQLGAPRIDIRPDGRR